MTTRGLTYMEIKSIFSLDDMDKGHKLLKIDNKISDKEWLAFY